MITVHLTDKEATAVYLALQEIVEQRAENKQDCRPYIRTMRKIEFAPKTKPAPAGGEATK